MDFSKLNEMLREFVQEDKQPYKKLTEQLYQLNIPERIDYLNYIKSEHERGVINGILEQRFENEEPPTHLNYSDNELTPRDTFFQHIQDLGEHFDRICTKTIPEQLKEYQRQIKDTIDRQRAMEKYGMGSQDNPLEEEMLTVEQAAEFLGKTVKTIYSYTSKRNQKLIPYTYGRDILIPKSQLMAMLKKK